MKNSSFGILHSVYHSSEINRIKPLSFLSLIKDM